MKTMRRVMGVLALLGALVELGCKTDDRALVLEGLRAGDRCATAVFDGGTFAAPPPRDGGAE